MWHSAWVTISINDTQQNSALLLCWMSLCECAFYLLLCWMSLCRVSLCWMSLCWVCILFTIMLNVVMAGVILLLAIMLSVIKLSVNMLSVIMLSVIMLSFINFSVIILHMNDRYVAMKTPSHLFLSLTCLACPGLAFTEISYEILTISTWTVVSYLDCGLNSRVLSRLWS